MDATAQNVLIKCGFNYNDIADTLFKTQNIFFVPYKKLIFWQFESPG